MSYGDVEVSASEQLSNSDIVEISTIIPKCALVKNGTLDVGVADLKDLNSVNDSELASNYIITIESINGQGTIVNIENKLHDTSGISLLETSKNNNISNEDLITFKLTSDEIERYKNLGYTLKKSVFSYRVSGLKSDQNNDELIETALKIKESIVNDIELEDFKFIEFTDDVFYQREAKEGALNILKLKDESYGFIGEFKYGNSDGTTVYFLITVSNVSGSSDGTLNKDKFNVEIHEIRYSYPLHETVRYIEELGIDQLK